MLDIIILAAGKGTRMQSETPKVLHSIGGKSLLAHVVNTAQSIDNSKIHVVVGHGSEQVKDTFSADNSINFVEQKQQLGTGHAVQQVLPFLDKHSTTLILYGDVPLTTLETLDQLTGHVDENTLALLTVNLADPTGYGRIVRDEQQRVTSIVEQKDATSEELAINEVNTGILALKSQYLMQWLPMLSNDNAQGEFYLTDIIAMAVAEGLSIATEQPEDEWEVVGVNNRHQQAELERRYQKNIANQLMINGVTLLDPDRFDCRGEIQCGSDVVVDINCVFEGKNLIGNNVSIGPNCVIKNSNIGDNTLINANSILEDATVASDCSIGPFARLRPGTELSSKAKIGNFVETKKSLIGEGSKVNHLSYVGDATLGKDVNIGAGTITCNYDGVNKFQTTIGDKVFIGSNSALVAPVNISEGATVGAGSTITKNIEANKLSLTRSPQRTIDDWQRPTKKK
jgi:bifunctional UDP-N-acetylglucosamine pyrophosphorylase/glucosamine-1-phosphate N-acetyltransferase